MKQVGYWLGQRWSQLRVRIVALFGAIALITYIYSGLSIHQALQEDLVEASAAKLQAGGHQIVAQLEAAVVEGGEAALVLGALSVSEPRGEQIRLFDAGGQLLYATASLTQDGPAVQAALAGQEQLTTLTAGENGERFVAVLLPMRRAGRVVGVVELAASLQEVDLLAAVLQPRLLGGLVLSLVAIGGAGIYLARNITRTLGEIERAARHISQGNFQYRITGGGSDEVGRLISTVNEMAAELQRLSETRAEFLSNVSHELCTPLTIIKGFTITLGQEIAAPSQRRVLEIIDQQTDHLTRLVDDLLILSRLEAGGPSLETRQVDLAALGRQVVESLSARARQAGLHLGFETEDGLAPAKVDVQRLQQVLYNLLDNAFKHTPAGGHVVLTVSRRKEEVCLAVRDDGEGIPADKLPHIFERFFQVELGSGGVGLGLAVVKEVVEAHGGVVGVESAVGRGTTFVVRLPAAEGQMNGR